MYSGHHICCPFAPWYSLLKPPPPNPGQYIPGSVSATASSDCPSYHPPKEAASVNNLSRVLPGVPLRARYPSYVVRTPAGKSRMPPGNQSGQEAEPCVRLEQARKASWRSGTGKSEYRLYGALQPRQRGTAGVGRSFLFLLPSFNLWGRCKGLEDS